MPVLSPRFGSLRARACLCSLVALGLLWNGLACEAVEDVRTIAVIVSAKHGMAELHANDLSLIYWRKKLYGAHGEVLHPANLYADHPLRQRFSHGVLHSTPASQVAYWNGLYFHGVQPPYTVQSEEAMMRYVAETEHAIGYVDACHLDSRVKPMLWVVADRILTEQPALACERAGE